MDLLIVLLSMSFVAGMVLGATLMVVLAPAKNEGCWDGCQLPERVLITKAGKHYHLTYECPSMKLSGRRRTGTVEYEVCADCYNTHCRGLHSKPARPFNQTELPVDVEPSSPS